MAKHLQEETECFDVRMREMEIVNSDVVGVVDEHDPANWELDPVKLIDG